MSAPAWWVYLLRCADDTFYVGVARNLQQRLREHNGDVRGGARYTQGRRPVTLYAARECADRRAATQLEWQTKRLPRARKAALPGANDWLSGADALLLTAADQQGRPESSEQGDQPPMSED